MNFIPGTKTLKDVKLNKILAYSIMNWYFPFVIVDGRTRKQGQGAGKCRGSEWRFCQVREQTNLMGFKKPTT